MKTNTREARAIKSHIAGLDKGNDAPTGNTAGADHQLHHIGSPGIGYETGSRRGGIEQCRIAGVGFIGEGPIEGQRLRCRRG